MFIILMFQHFTIIIWLELRQPIFWIKQFIIQIESVNPVSLPLALFMGVCACMRVGMGIVKVLTVLLLLSILLIDPVL